MTYEDELREEHEHELDRRDDERLDSAIAYTERENANLHRAVERLERENRDMVATLEAIKPTFYGMLLKEFGNPDKWPDDRQGIVVFRKLEQALALEGDA